MSGSTAELPATAVGTESRLSSATLAKWLAGQRLYLTLAAAGLVIGALSLVIPSTPSYDPWAWLVWGREIVHLNLQTTGGPTWKPLPMIFTTVFAPFGSAAPDLWLIVARAGAVMAAAMVFKLAFRLVKGIAGAWSGDRGSTSMAGAGTAGSSQPLVIAPAVLAGLIASASLILSDGFIADNALGYSEGLMTALVLIALELHLDGKPRLAFAVGFAAALDRPEIWLLWGPYGLWLWWKDPGARKLVLALFVLIPVLWFLPEYWGSGKFLRGVSRAQNPRSNSPAFAKCPFCSLIADHAWPTVLLRIKVAAALAVGAASWLLLRAWRGGARRPRDDRERALAVLVLVGVLGLGWWLIIGVMTQAGFSGNNRYLVLGAALIEIAGGVGWGWVGFELGARTRAWWRKRSGADGDHDAGAARRSVARIGLAATALLAVGFVLIPGWVGNNYIDLRRTYHALVYQARLREDASSAVRRLGGQKNIYACGTVMTEGFQVPMLAWTLGVHTLQVAAPAPGGPLPPPPNVIFQTRAQRKSHLLPVVRAWTNTSYQRVAHVRTFRVFEHCLGSVEH
ncbi:MAG: hypothetical protein JO153_03275 [Solirubrobacterales bacterium]|nr:hypothetical protein [Solirubrobacterales bacterium]